MSSSSRTIAIDDSDTTRIKYAGTWNTRNNAKEFGSTAHGSGSVGSSVTIQFTGSSIQVIGSIPEEGEEEDSSSTTRLNFRLDSMDLPAYTHRLPQEGDLYSQTVLKQDVPNGDHTLAITLDTASKGNTPTFYFDYVLVATQALQEDSDLIFLDNTDPSLAYEGSWSTSASVHTTKEVSSKITFKFNGTYVKMVGSTSRSGATVNIDGNTSKYTPVTLADPHIILEQDNLSNAEHQVFLSPATNEQLSLDYVLYRPSKPKANNGDPSPGIGDGRSGDGTRRGGPSGGAIAGIVIGVVLGIGLVVGAIWFIKRSRRHRTSSETERERKAATYSESDVEGISEAQRPFLITMPTSADTPLFSPSTASSNSTPMIAVASDSQTYSTSIAETDPLSPSYVPAKAGEGIATPQPLVLSWTPPEALPPIVHEDSGVRLDDDGLGRREELPPAYRTFYPSNNGHGGP